MNTEQRPFKNCCRRGAAPRLAGILAAGIFLGAFHSHAQTNGATNTVDSGPTFDSFRVITRNNIFDPNRSPGYVPQHHAATHHTIDAFALVGTMSYPKGRFAFFNGSSSDYKKVLEPGATIAGYTVKDITPHSVILAANGKEFEMKVGSQMRNEGNNQWSMSDYSDVSTAPESTGETTTAESSAPPTGATPDATEALKRLMQLRQQEQQQIK